MPSMDTALCVLDLRATCSDIPFAREMAALMHAEEAQVRTVGEHNVPKIREALGALLELRHQSLQAALESNTESGFLLDIASGFGLRGLLYTQQAGRFCLETDLSDIIKLKRNVAELLSGGALRPNHQMMPLDVMSADDWRAAAEVFPKDARPTIIIEGLLPYFPMEKKELVLELVCYTLMKFPRGARFITPDFITKEELEMGTKLSATYVKPFEEKLGTNFADNAFESENDMRAMLYGIGFGKVEIVPQSKFYPIRRLKQKTKGVPMQFLRAQRLAIASL